MQMDPAGVPSSTPLQQSQPITRVCMGITMAIPPTVKESKHVLQRGTNCHFVGPVFLFFTEQAHFTPIAAFSDAELTARS